MNWYQVVLCILVPGSVFVCLCLRIIRKVKTINLHIKDIHVKSNDDDERFDALYKEFMSLLQEGK